jgi:hypothetical protein
MHDIRAKIFPRITLEYSSDRTNVTGQAKVRLGHRVTNGGASIDGVGVEWVWDGERFELRGDRFGCFPCFYCVDGNRLLVATTLHDAVEMGAPRELDSEAISAFLITGYFVDGDTPLKAIRRLGPNARIKWQDGRLSVTSALPDVKVQFPSYAAAVDGYLDLFATAIRSRSPGGSCFVHPLSGGRDSRHILLELHRQAHLPREAFTVALSRAQDPHSDVAIAARVCRELGIAHRVLDPWKTSFIDAERLKNFLTGVIGSEGAWMIPARGYVEGATTTLYDGIGGDMLSAGLALRPEWLPKIRARDYDGFIDRLAGTARPVPARGEFFEAANQALGRAGFCSVDSGKHHLRRVLDKFTSLHNALTAFMFFNRTVGIIAAQTYGIYRSVENLYAPYLDHDLFDFLFSLPEEMLEDNAFHSAAITRGYPEFAHIPYTARENVRPITGGVLSRVRILAEMTWNIASVCPQQLGRVARWLAVMLRGGGSPALPRQDFVLLLECARLAGGPVLDEHLLRLIPDA